MEDDFQIPLQDVKRQVRRGLIECQKRGLVYSAKWLAEMNHGLSEVDVDSSSPEDEEECSLESTLLEGISPPEYDDYFLAKSYFDLREYDRAAYFVRKCESPVPRFLHFYSIFMAREKRRLDSTTDQSNLNEAEHVRDLADLMTMLRSEHARKSFDGYGLYLYGIVLKALNLKQAALQMLVQSIRLAPMLWSAYIELAPLISEKEKLQVLHFGGHWMRNFFVAFTYIELYLNDEAIKAYEDLQSVGFRKCLHVTSQMALAYHNKRDVEKAIEIFQALQEADPYRLDNLDIYSNLLFVKELKTEMAQLAHKAVNINKYRPETCCVIGNYYSIRCDHQMAIMYFQRALKLNPKYLAAWTLMGHEFMELKNTNAAIQSYRKAVEVNKRDYRAWYGLGQSYEILKMHYYSLYYFKIAHQLRPYDSRMLVALGETYEKLDKNENAIKCYMKACNVGDIEGIAMYKIASLHEKLGDLESAVQWYVLYCEDARAAADKQNLYHSYMVLANYYDSKANYDLAHYYAFKCLDSDERKSEAKSLLKTIENKRLAIESEMKKTCSSVTTVIPSAGSSSDDDMDLELSDCKFSGSDGMPSNRSSVKTNILTTVSSTTAHGTPTTGNTSPNENDMIASTSAAASARAAAGGRQGSLSSTAAVQTADDASEASETQSMEISSISID